MGYTTIFEDQFDIMPPLTPEHRAYLACFAEVRHMTRDATLLEQIPDPLREAVGLPPGPEGLYFVGSTEPHGQDFHHPSVREGSCPPHGAPGLWCQWVPNEEGTALLWDGIEKFYRYIPWLAFLIEHFLAPWGYTVEGTVHWQGEDADDTGMILVKENQIREEKGETLLLEALVPSDTDQKQEYRKAKEDLATYECALWDEQTPAESLTYLEQQANKLRALIFAYEHPEVASNPYEHALE